MNHQFSATLSVMGGIMTYLGPKDLARCRQVSRLRYANTCEIVPNWQHYVQSHYRVHRCGHCKALRSMHKTECSTVHRILSKIYGLAPPSIACCGSPTSGSPSSAMPGHGARERVPHQLCVVVVRKIYCRFNTSKFSYSLPAAGCVPHT